MALFSRFYTFCRAMTATLCAHMTGHTHVLSTMTLDISSTTAAAVTAVLLPPNAVARYEVPAAVPISVF